MNVAADLLIDARGPEILHRSGLTAPDSFIYLYPEGGKPTVFFDAREYGVQHAKLTALNNGVQIKALEPYLEQAKSASAPTSIAVLLCILNEYGASTLRISRSLSYEVGHALEKAGKKVSLHPYEAEREHKTEDEITHLITAQRVNESAFELAWHVLAQSMIAGATLIHEDTVLTSEKMKSLLRKHLLDKGYECPEGIVVACGLASARPHDMGTGPLLPHECIIIDIFPRSEETGFFADMTRTFVKGEPAADILALYDAVETVQRQVIETMQIGDQCAAVYARTVDAFSAVGYESSPTRGFMHRTGHSLGLSIHEEPDLSVRSHRVIEPGMVFTVEPGLYYPEIGGVRLEDVVVFHPDGRKENITRFTRPYIIL